VFLRDALWGLILPVTTLWREDDIYRGYWVQRMLWEIGARMVYTGPTGYQVRNPHDFVLDLGQEIHMYRDTATMLRKMNEWECPKNMTLPECIVGLQAHLADNHMYIECADVELVAAWLSDLVSLGYKFPKRTSGGHDGGVIQRFGADTQTCSQPIKMPDEYMAKRKDMSRNELVKLFDPVECGQGATRGCSQTQLPDDASPFEKKLQHKGSPVKAKEYEVQASNDGGGINLGEKNLELQQLVDQLQDQVRTPSKDMQEKNKELATKLKRRQAGIEELHNAQASAAPDSASFSKDGILCQQSMCSLPATVHGALITSLFKDVVKAGKCRQWKANSRSNTLMHYGLTSLLMARPTVLVLGSCGMIGLQLVPELRSQGFGVVEVCGKQHLDLRRMHALSVFDAIPHIHMVFMLAANPRVSSPTDVQLILTYFLSWQRRRGLQWLMPVRSTHEVSPQMRIASLRQGHLLELGEVELIGTAALSFPARHNTSMSLLHEQCRLSSLFRSSTLRLHELEHTANLLFVKDVIAEMIIMSVFPRYNNNSGGLTKLAIKGVKMSLIQVIEQLRAGSNGSDLACLRQLPALTQDMRESPSLNLRVAFLLELNALHQVELRKKEMSRQNGQVYLSIVMVSRNDDHGEGLLERIQNSLNLIAFYAQRYLVLCEVIIVEWNPPASKATLDTVLQWPKHLKHRLRFIRVPNSLHSQLPGSATFPLFEYLGKNVGIRRAHGEFILVTNPDSVLDEAFWSWAGRQELKQSPYYRQQRVNLPSEALVQTKGNPMQQMRALRERYGYRPCCTGVESLIPADSCSGAMLACTRVESLIPGAGNYTLGVNTQVRENTDAPGDFLLASREKWHKMGGFNNYVGDRATNTHLDSAGVIKMAATSYPYPALEILLNTHSYHQFHQKAYGAESGKKTQFSHTILVGQEMQSALKQFNCYEIDVAEQWGFPMLRFIESHSA